MSKPALSIEATWNHRSFRKMIAYDAVVNEEYCTVDLCHLLGFRHHEE
eukprot:IDg15993t1